jgi:hypothetical protein
MDNNHLDHAIVSLNDKLALGAWQVAFHFCCYGPLVIAALLVVFEPKYWTPLAAAAVGLQTGLWLIWAIVRWASQP